MTRTACPSVLAAFVAALLAGFLAAPGAASAHESRPLAITLSENQQGDIDLRWRTPASVEPSNAPTVSLGAPCTLSGPLRRAAPYEASARYRCAIQEGVELTIDWPLYNPSVSTLVRLERPTGETATQTLGPSERTWTIPPPETFAGVARSYLILGVEHILIGIDHVLFVLGLMILARTPSRVLMTATGFTIAHSVTLALVALDVLRAPIATVEAIIALSIVFVAAEIARNDRTTLAWRRPIIVAAAFGLLHGAGFAAALGDIGLPQTERVAALLFFNVGVEVGQALIIAAGFAAFYLVLGARRMAQGGPAPLPAGAQTLAGYGLGVVAAYWFVQRAVSVLVT